MKSLKLLGALGAVVLLSGCGAFGVEQLRGTTGSTAGTPFTQALTQEYRSLALFEYDQMKDWPDSYRFAAKGLAAARGEAVAPENPADWSLSAAKRQELEAARGRLVTALGSGPAQRLPAIAAKAQAKYDCWVEQEEEGWQTADIASCRGEFNALLAQLVDPPAVAAPAPAPAPIADRNYIVFFEWDSARLTAEAIRIIDQAATEARNASNTRITIVGHADRSGPEGYNLRLSLRRADAVRGALSQRGIATERTAVTALGESEPRVPTADGVREPQNRRVTVTIR